MATPIHPSTVARIGAAVLHARTKHPAHKPPPDRWWLAMIEELGEIAEAEQDGAPRARVEAEILDAIAVLVRKLEQR